MKTGQDLERVENINNTLRNQIDNLFELSIDIGMSKDIQAFFEGREEIEYYDIQIQKNVVLIDVKLVEFSLISARELFYGFVKFVSYMETNIVISEYVDRKIKILFFTSIDGITGTKMEITIG